MTRPSDTGCCPTPHSNTPSPSSSSTSNSACRSYTPSTILELGWYAPCPSNEDTAFKIPLPDSVFPSICQHLFNNDDKPSLLAIQRVNRAGWSAALPFVLHKVKLRDQGDVTSFYSSFVSNEEERLRRAKAYGRNMFLFHIDYFDIRDLFIRTSMALKTLDTISETFHPKHLILGWDVMFDVGYWDRVMSDLARTLGYMDVSALRDPEVLYNLYGHGSLVFPHGDEFSEWVKSIEELPHSHGHYCHVLFRLYAIDLASVRKICLRMCPDEIDIIAAEHFANRAELHSANQGWNMRLESRELEVLCIHGGLLDNTYTYSFGSPNTRIFADSNDTPISLSPLLDGCHLAHYGSRFEYSLKWQIGRTYPCCSRGWEVRGTHPCCSREEAELEADREERIVRKLWSMAGEWEDKEEWEYPTKFIDADTVTFTPQAEMEPCEVCGYK